MVYRPTRKEDELPHYTSRIKKIIKDRSKVQSNISRSSKGCDVREPGKVLSRTHKRFTPQMLGKSYSRKAEIVIPEHIRSNAPVSVMFQGNKDSGFRQKSVRMQFKKSV